MYQITCVRCGDAVMSHTTSTLMCRTCQNRHNAESLLCGRAVAKAIRQGLLPRADTCICADCGAAASEWEHRDYLKPLDVEPICRSCNNKRGPALDSVMRNFPAPRVRKSRQERRAERMRA